MLVLSKIEISGSRHSNFQSFYFQDNNGILYGGYNACPTMPPITIISLLILHFIIKLIQSNMPLPLLLLKKNIRTEPINQTTVAILDILLLYDTLVLVRTPRDRLWRCYIYFPSNGVLVLVLTPAASLHSCSTRGKYSNDAQSTN